jgi:hypothetical protein
MANSIEYFKDPRIVLREVRAWEDTFDRLLVGSATEYCWPQAWRCLKPGGSLIIAFSGKQKANEDRQIKVG